MEQVEEKTSGLEEKVDELEYYDKNKDKPLRKKVKTCEIHETSLLMHSTNHRHRWRIIS